MFHVKHFLLLAQKRGACARTFGNPGRRSVQLRLLESLYLKRAFWGCRGPRLTDKASNTVFLDHMDNPVLENGNRVEIARRLREIEGEEGVRIFFACESGSRAWLSVERQ